MGFCITRHQWATLLLLYEAGRGNGKGLSASALAAVRSPRSGRSGLQGAYDVLKSLASKHLAEGKEGHPRTYVITPLGLAMVKVGSEVEKKSRKV